jgi:hypothetical protein
MAHKNNASETAFPTPVHPEYPYTRNCTRIGIEGMPMSDAGDRLGEVGGSIDNEPVWLGKLRRSAFAFVFFAAGALVAQVTNLADGVGRLYDRFSKEPEAFVLADRSAKSTFSDQLAERAWRRMFWANNFRARVENVAPLTDIDASWKSYIDADADWNANIMIAIVGLRRYYDEKRSARLEGPIQTLFANLDAQLASLRNSEVVRALREGRSAADPERQAAKAASGEVVDALDKVNRELYALVRCIRPPNDKSGDNKNECL